MIFSMLFARMSDDLVCFGDEPPYEIKRASPVFEEVLHALVWVVALSRLVEAFLWDFFLLA